MKKLSEIYTPSNDKQKLKIAVVVVTYNRKKLLLELLESLLVQTRPIDTIFIIDNKSTDGTSEYIQDFLLRVPSAKYLIQEENLGGSGGFYSGVKMAFEEGHDWIWMVDDDVEAFPDAIEGLLSYTDISGCIQGSRLHADGRPYFWQVRFYESIGYWLPVLGVGFNKDNFFETNTGCFEGMFVSRRVIEKIGFPDPRFFITWDDAIYGWLASKVTQVIYVNSVILKRKRELSSFDLGFRDLSTASDLYRYYTIKNRLIVREYIKQYGEYNRIGFCVGSWIIFSKELLRIVLVDRSWKSVLAIFKGYKDQKDFVSLEEHINGK